ncbi:HNH endonuclease signature motif containing protein [Nocardia xishanensis]|uniref:HNH endonuclease signature motif containing protein n=1 Tax=Nocardia xishanensis TaxID=238964 RepID=UPI0009FCC024|nr:HNH endonuclease signature motif containing protein [Nocardia xishanensis]
MTTRDSIPADLVRDLMIEAGYRCAVPTCRTVEPLDIEHIEDYAVVRKHEFSNMIVLCTNCHRRKGTGPRKIDRKALRIIKQNLSVVNQRYNELERRILEHFVENADDRYVLLPETPVLFSYLIKDGLIVGLSGSEVKEALHGETEGGRGFHITRGYALTDDGKRLVAKLRESAEAI